MIIIRKTSILLIAIATGLLTACSNSNTGNSNFSMPAIDTTKVSPTATPTTTPTTSTALANSPSTSPKPAIAPTNLPSNLPELEIKELEPYKHRSGILEMTVPKGWKVADQSQTGEILVTWNEKSGRATISTNIFVPPSEIPENRLGDTFTTIIKGMYGNQPDFAMQAPVVETTGTIVIVWTSTLTIGNTKLKFLANSKLQRSNNKFVILTFGAIEPKFVELRDYFVKIANNQIVNASLAIP